MIESTLKLKDSFELFIQYFIPAGVIGIFTDNSYSKLLERFANFLDDLWVVGNKENLEKYRLDKYCTYKYPIASMVEIFKINHDMHNIKNYKFQNKNLEILSVSGALDPMTGFEKGLNDNKKVYKDILDFLSE